MKELLIDVLEHIHFSVNVNAIKIDLNEDFEIYAIAENKEVIINAKIIDKKIPLPLKGCFGIKNMSQLSSFLKDPYLSIASVKDVDGNSRKIVFESSKTGNTVEHYFISKKILDETVPYGRLSKPLKWYAAIDITDDLHKKLKQQMKACKDEYHFLLTQKDGKLVFSFGDWSTAVFGAVDVDPLYTIEVNKKYSDRVPNFFSNHYKYWPAKTFTNIINKSGKYTMHISNDDYMLIICETDYATYEYILPGHGL